MVHPMPFHSSNVYSAKYHLILCPKYRRPVLVGDVEVGLVEPLEVVRCSVENQKRAV
jgi:REP element-mobilizing transposase RayT